MNNFTLSTNAKNECWFLALLYLKRVLNRQLLKYIEGKAYRPYLKVYEGILLHLTMPSGQYSIIKFRWSHISKYKHFTVYRSHLKCILYRLRIKPLVVADE